MTRTEDDTPLPERHLWLEGRVSNAALARVARGLPRVDARRSRACFVGFSYADLAVPKAFDMLFDLDHPERCWPVACRIVAVTQQFSAPWQEIPHGWRTICVVEFSDGVPEVVDRMPVVDSWHATAERIGLCDRRVHAEIVRARRGAPTHAAADAAAAPQHNAPSGEGPIDPRLSTLIRAYQRAVAEAVAMLEASGIRRPSSNTEWATTRLPRDLSLPGGYSVFKHGYGCAVKGPASSVDFDFGDEGQIDGFDAWRLCAFAGERLRGYGFSSEKDIAAAIRVAADAGALVFSGYILYYVVGVERGAGEG